MSAVPWLPVVEARGEEIEEHLTALAEILGDIGEADYSIDRLRLYVAEDIDRLDGAFEGGRAHIINSIDWKRG